MTNSAGFTGFGASLWACTEKARAKMKSKTKIFFMAVSLSKREEIKYTKNHLQYQAFFSRNPIYSTKGLIDL
jgi:hypothetical protein